MTEKSYEILMSALEDNLYHGLAYLCGLVGDDPNREGLRGTPKRIAKMWVDLLSIPKPDCTKFKNPGYDQMIVETGIPFVSMCEHHLLPFIGKAAIGYLPETEGYVLGLSKLARVLDYFAARLQLQERLTKQVAEFLQEELRPKGIGVVLAAEHFCMSVRGVKKPGTLTYTSHLTGAFRDGPVKDEFLRLAHS
jgi:GTP cyclohydrolase I